MKVKHIQRRVTRNSANTRIPWVPQEGVTRSGRDSPDPTWLWLALAGNRLSDRIQFKLLKNGSVYVQAYTGLSRSD